ncbi:hypothetical protein [Rubellimicrobium rubrum]|uniref:hypothetical protein n=1 Tax=Rubellimicrobium rubrum TaxID=2585369 RepID=UPI00159BD9F3|nr:hypothetical protein [Rubellimicrobium rubrum]
MDASDDDRDHESLGSLTPSDVWLGRGRAIPAERERIRKQTLTHWHWHWLRHARAG